MKNHLFVTVVLAAFIFSACNKKGGADSSLVKEISSSKGRNTSFFYNSDNTLKSQTNPDGSKIAYKYNGKTVDEDYMDSVHGISVNSTFYLNSAGYADSLVGTTPKGKSSKIFKRDANNFAVSTVDMSGPMVQQVANSIIKDGNVVETDYLADSDKPLGRYVFDFYTDKPNSIGDVNKGMKFLGSDSKNLVKREVRIRNSGDTIAIGCFKYHFDDKGRVNSVVITDPTGAMVYDSSSVSYY